MGTILVTDDVHSLDEPLVDRIQSLHTLRECVLYVLDGFLLLPCHNGLFQSCQNRLNRCDVLGWDVPLYPPTAAVAGG